MTVEAWGPAPLTPELADGVHVWAAALDDPALAERYRVSLSAEERERAGRFRFEEHRRRFLIAHAFLRDVLARYLGVHPAGISFQTGEHGKPRLAGTLTESHLEFNLSHSGDTAICALAQGRNIGADIELIRAVPRLDTIVDHYFAAGERMLIDTAPEGEARERMFFKCWTKKEAYIKAVGGGLSIPLTSFDTAAPVPGWTILDLPAPEGTAGAIAVEGELQRLTCWMWKPAAMGE